MTTLLSAIVTPFITGNYEDFQYFGAYSVDTDKQCILIHNEKTIFKNNKGVIFIELTGNENLTIDLLNKFEGIKAVSKNGKIYINGYEWDGAKTDLNLFID